MPDEPATLIARAREAESSYQWDAAAAAYEQALTMLSQADAPPIEQAPLLASIGRCYRCMGEARTAWRSLMRAIAIFRDAGDAEAMADTSLEALRIWSPRERQRAIANAALEMLGPGESRRHAHLLFCLDRPDDALAIASRHGYDEIIAHDEQWMQGQQLVLDGRHDEYLALVRRAHELQSAIGDIDRAASVLRGPGYGLLAYGDFTRGLAMAEEAAAYAGARNLRFQHQLPALDVAGVYFARNELERCDAMLDTIPGDLDFRKDLLRAWVAERRGDHDAAVAMLPTPDRAGGASDALTQVHSGRAGVLWRAGRESAARHDFEAYVEAGRNDLRLLHDAPAAFEPLMAVGDAGLFEAIREVDAGPERLNRYSTLQGRGLDRVRGGVAAKLGLRGGSGGALPRGHRVGDARTLHARHRVVPRGTGAADEVGAQRTVHCAPIERPVVP